jgi:hypothetical protein
MANPIVTCEIVRELLNYDPDTGIFTWRYRDRKYFPSDRAQKIWNVRFFGKEAGSKYLGYLIILIFGRRFKAHRLAFLYMTGSFPDMEIDHIDRNKSNNAFKNLREVSSSGNHQNVFNPQSNNKLKIRGVRQTASKKFGAQIKVNGEYYHIGTFETAAQAEAAYLAAKAALHPEAVFTLDTA